LDKAKYKNEFLKKVQATLWKGLREIDFSHKHLSISKQCQLIGRSRSHHYYKKRMERIEDIQEKMKIKEGT